MEQVYVAVMPLLCRIRVSFPESQETAMRDLREIGPTHSAGATGMGADRG